jgi:hypothetical protein
MRFSIRYVWAWQWIFKFHISREIFSYVTSGWRRYFSVLYLDFVCCHIEGFMNIPRHDEAKNTMAKKNLRRKSRRWKWQPFVSKRKRDWRCSQFRMTFKEEEEYWYGIREDHFSKDNSLRSYEWNRLWSYPYKNLSSLIPSIYSFSNNLTAFDLCL